MAGRAVSAAVAGPGAGAWQPVLALLEGKYGLPAERPEPVVKITDWTEWRLLSPNSPLRLRPGTTMTRAVVMVHARLVARRARRPGPGYLGRRLGRSGGGRRAPGPADRLLQRPLLRRRKRPPQPRSAGPPCRGRLRRTPAGGRRAGGGAATVGHVRTRPQPLLRRRVTTAPPNATVLPMLRHEPHAARHGREIACAVPGRRS